MTHKRGKPCTGLVPYRFPKGKFPQDMRLPPQILNTTLFVCRKRMRDGNRITVPVGTGFLVSVPETPDCHAVYVVTASKGSRKIAQRGHFEVHTFGWRFNGMDHRRRFLVCSRRCRCGHSSICFGGEVHSLVYPNGNLHRAGARYPIEFHHTNPGDAFTYAQVRTETRCYCWAVLARHGAFAKPTNCTFRACVKNAKSRIRSALA